MMRLLVGVGAALILVALPTGIRTPARADIAPPPAVPIPQTLTGGGIGVLEQGHFPFLDRDGLYSSTGQLGAGSFHTSDGVSTSTARFTRSDGTKLQGSIRPGSSECGPIVTNTHCLVADLDGTADIVHAHLTLVVLDDYGRASRTSFEMKGTLTLLRRIGYALVDSRGSTYMFGGVDHIADANADGIVDLALSTTGNGYWIATDAGVVYAFGDARAFNRPGGPSLSIGDRVTSVSATPTGAGYWLFTSQGRVLPFGDAKFFGDMRTTTLIGGIVGSVATPTGKGYYMVGSDGGVFAFGDARFRGSMGGVHLNQPVVGLVPATSDAGYWLVASDGGVFSFGAPFHGSMGAIPLNRPVVAMVAYADAYLMIASDGGLFNFSKGPFFGSLGSAPIPSPIVSGAAIG